MAFANFQDLCNAVCELVNMQPPELSPDGEGAAAIGLTLGDVQTELFHEPVHGERTAQLLVRFGPLPEVDRAQQALSLLSANLYLRSRTATRFAWDDDHHEVVVLATLSLDECSDTDVYGLMLQLAEDARTWRKNQTGFFASRNSNDPEPATSASNVNPMR